MAALNDMQETHYQTSITDMVAKCNLKYSNLKKQSIYATDSVKISVKEMTDRKTT